MAIGLDVAMPQSHDDLSAFLRVRPRLFGIAYRMLGSAAEADDVVQDVWVRWQMADRSVVRDAAAFLATTTTRLAINVMHSARARREANVGPRLPEPADTRADPGLGAERNEALELGVTVLLERLSPTERAAYILREAFEYAYRDIAGVLRLREANARQVVTRARQHLAGGRRTPVKAAEQRRLLASFIAAARHGDVTGLEGFLASLPPSLEQRGPLSGEASRFIRSERNIPDVYMTKRPLAGKVALVAGATRGAGRGIAVALGEAGATVYCTGRSVRDRPAMKNRPETIQETADMVTARGGHGIAVRVDHTVPAEVASLLDRTGELDILINDIWGGDDLVEWGKKLWETKLEDGLTLIDRAIKTHIITSYYALPRMRSGGVVVEITDGDAYFYRGHFFYDLVKTTVIRMAFALSQELKDRDITALAVTPGFLRSEWMLDHFGVTEANWRDAAQKVPEFIASETPLFVGRCVAALAADANVRIKNGRVFASWDLADEYGVDDADGTRPHFVRWLRQNQPEVAASWKKLDDTFYAYWGSMPYETPG